jgi:hypothetical protein
MTARSRPTKSRALLGHPGTKCTFGRERLRISFMRAFSREWWQAVRFYGNGCQEFHGKTFGLTAAPANASPLLSHSACALPIHADLFLSAANQSLLERLVLQLDLGICAALNQPVFRKGVLRKQSYQHPGVGRHRRGAKHGPRRDYLFSQPAQHDCAQRVDAGRHGRAVVYTWQIGRRIIHSKEKLIVLVSLSRHICVHMHDQDIDQLKQRIRTH